MSDEILVNHMFQKSLIYSNFHFVLPRSAITTAILMDSGDEIYLFFEVQNFKNVHYIFVTNPYYLTISMVK